MTKHCPSAVDEVLSFDSLLFPVHSVHMLLVIHDCFCLLHSAFMGVDSDEVGRTPHLVGVELVRAAVLVGVFLLVHAVEEGVLGLEAELAVVLVGLEVAHQVEPVVTVVHYSLILFKYL